MGGNVVQVVATSYFPVLVFFCIAFGLGIAIVSASLFVSKRTPTSHKNAPYECGFDPFTEEPGRFSVRFYLVSILFIIFDLEVAFLFPWAAAFGSLGIAGFISVLLFLITLTIGFIYEWKKGALEWE
jgi:NADH-quinone oxidoreductase subunit A